MTWRCKRHLARNRKFESISLQRRVSSNSVQTLPPWRLPRSQGRGHYQHPLRLTKFPGDLSWRGEARASSRPVGAGDPSRSSAAVGAACPAGIPSVEDAAPAARSAMFSSPSNFSYGPRSSVPRRSFSALYDWPLTAEAQPPLHDPRAHFARTPGLGEIRHSGLGVPGQALRRERRRRCPQPSVVPSLTQYCTVGESAASGVADRAAISPYHQRDARTNEANRLTVR
jgi:hypothetical protein